MIRKKVKHIYFKSFIDNADIINTHNYFTSYSEFFTMKNQSQPPQSSLIRIIRRPMSENLLMNDGNKILSEEKRIVLHIMNMI